MKNIRASKPDPSIGTWLWFHREIFHSSLSASAILAYLALCYFSYRHDGVYKKTKAYKVIKMSCRRYKNGLGELILKGLVAEVGDKYVLLQPRGEVVRVAIGKWGWVYRADFEQIVQELGSSALLVYCAIAAHVLVNQVSITGAEYLQRLCGLSRPTFYAALRALETSAFVCREKCGRRVQLGLRSLLSLYKLAIEIVADIIAEESRQAASTEDDEDCAVSEVNARSNEVLLEAATLSAASEAIYQEGDMYKNVLADDMYKNVHTCSAHIYEDALVDLSAGKTMPCDVQAGVEMQGTICTKTCMSSITSKKESEDLKEKKKEIKVKGSAADFEHIASTNLNVSGARSLTCHADGFKTVGDALSSDDVQLNEPQKDELVKFGEEELRKSARGSLGTYLKLCLAKRRAQSQEAYYESLRVAGIDIDAPLERVRQIARESWRKRGVDPEATDAVRMIKNAENSQSLQQPQLSAEKVHDALVRRGIAPTVAAAWCKSYETSVVYNAMTQCSTADNFTRCMHLELMRHKPKSQQLKNFF